jgi:hypothetical protein
MYTRTKIAFITAIAVPLNFVFAGTVGYGAYMVVAHTGVPWWVSLTCASWCFFNCKIVTVTVS